MSFSVSQQAAGGGTDKIDETRSSVGRFGPDAAERGESKIERNLSEISITQLKD